MNARIAAIKAGIEKTYRCIAEHVSSVPAKDLLHGNAHADGFVETFNLKGFAGARRCHAWSFIENSEPQYVTIMEMPPVNFRKTALQLAIEICEHNEVLPTLNTSRALDLQGCN